jgi:hypothetical protein
MIMILCGGLEEAPRSGHDFPATYKIINPYKIVRYAYYDLFPVTME